MKTEASARRRSREVALQALYALDLQRARDKSTDPEAVFESVAENFEMPTAARDFAAELVAAVWSRPDELDEVFGAHARNWRVSRMASVDRSILRMATWELHYSDTPTGVVLNEAVELARSFGSDESPAFINGILDAVARAREGAAPELAPARDIPLEDK